MRLSFLVTVDYPTILEPQVVRNYVKMAMMKYDKLCTSSGGACYFGGVYNPVTFNVTEMPEYDPDDLRELIEQIKKVKDHFEPVDNRYNYKGDTSG